MFKRLEFRTALAALTILTLYLVIAAYAGWDFTEPFGAVR